MLSGNSRVRSGCYVTRRRITWGWLECWSKLAIGLEYWLERVSGDSETEKKWTGAVLYQRGFEVGGGRGAFVT